MTSNLALGIVPEWTSVQGLLACRACAQGSHGGPCRWLQRGGPLSRGTCRVPMLLHLRPQFLPQDYGTYIHREPSVMIHTTKPDRRALKHLSCLRLDESSAGLLMRTARSSAVGMNLGAICSDWTCVIRGDGSLDDPYPGYLDDERVNQSVSQFPPRQMQSRITQYVNVCQTVRLPR